MSSSPISMSTPIDNIPLKTNNEITKDDDSNDPIVQDVLKEFENELSTHKKNQQQPPPSPPPQQNYQIPQQQPQYHQPPPQQPYQMKKDKMISEYIDIDFIKKSLIIIIIIYIIAYSNVLIHLYNFLPLNIFNIFTEYDIYIKLLLLFIIIYFLYFYELI